ncbi:MAG: hypothetical protein ABEH59_13940 [Halobacteriales archaeon]
MRRRQFLAYLGAAASLSLAGCSSGPAGTEASSPTAAAATPSPSQSESEGAYVPSHRDMMEMIGMQRDGRLLVTLSYTLPHEFFVVTGTRTNKTSVQSGDTMHLMTQVMDRETGVVAPGVEPTVTIWKDGERVTANQPWPMLSEPMGFHFGDNIAEAGTATYRFEVALNRPSGALSDDVADVFTDETVTFETEFDPASSAELGFQSTGDDAGSPGAIAPMQMEMMTVPQQPTYGSMPIEVTDPQITDDVAVSVGTHGDPASLGFSEGDRALVAATQSRYNRYPLGFMGVRATVTRDGEEVFAGDLTSAVSGELGHYYGAGVPPLDSGDTVELEFTTPPQIARHRGYEKAFLELEPLTYTL